MNGGVRSPAALAISSKVRVCSETNWSVECISLPSLRGATATARLRRSAMFSAPIFHATRRSRVRRPKSLACSPLRLIFPPRREHELAHGDQSWRPGEACPQRCMLASELAVERGDPPLRAGFAHHGSILVASIFSVKLSATETPGRHVTRVHSPVPPPSWPEVAPASGWRQTAKSAEKMRGTERRTRQVRASPTKAANRVVRHANFLALLDRPPIRAHRIADRAANLTPRRRRSFALGDGLDKFVPDHEGRRPLPLTTQGAVRGADHYARHGC